MGINLAQDWPVYLLLAAVVYFFIYVIINSKKQDRVSTGGPDKGKDKV